LQKVLRGLLFFDSHCIGLYVVCDMLFYSVSVLPRVVKERNSRIYPTLTVASKFSKFGSS